MTEQDHSGEATSDGGDGRRISEPMMLALIGLGVAVLLFVASAVPVLLSRDDGGGSDSAAGPTFGSIVNTPAPSTASAVDGASVAATDSTPVATAPPSTATAPPTTAAAAPPPTTTDDDAGSTTVPDDVDDGSEVQESIAIVKGGQIFLEGAVPDEASRDEIVALAAEIFAPENVIDNYVIDPRAGDPNIGNIRVDDAVLFAADSAQIAPDFEPLLNQGLALLTLRPAATFVIVGHTDDRGGDQYNLELSQARARAVVQWYVDRDIDPERLTAVGFGETDPIATNDTPEGRQQNRRIEVVIENLLVGDA